MKISSSRSGRSRGFSGTGQVSGGSFRQGEVSFGDDLKVARTRLVREDLERLLPHLDDAAQALIESRTLRNLARYRELVREVLDTVVREAHQLQETSGFSGGRHKVFVVVQKVDEALEQLGREILNEHANTVHLLEIVDEIRGMLLDLYT